MNEIKTNQGTKIAETVRIEDICLTIVVSKFNSGNKEVTRTVDVYKNSGDTEVTDGAQLFEDWCELVNSHKQYIGAKTQLSTHISRALSEAISEQKKQEKETEETTLSISAAVAGVAEVFEEQ